MQQGKKCGDKGPRHASEAEPRSCCRRSAFLSRWTGARALALLVLNWGLLPGPGGASAAAGLDLAGADLFERKIRPILVENCYQCHSAQAEKLKGGLRLDSREGTLKGGDTGPALVPGQPEKSLLIRAVRYADENLQMPPKNKRLSQEQIADLEAWVKLGAPDPRDDVPVAKPNNSEASKHWAFLPVRLPTVPQPRNLPWISTPVDAFILARLEEKNLSPSPRVDKRTLIRRAKFDLLGLPPTPAEVKEFVEDQSPGAFARLVDRLLASPHYGERWGRYWLDVARYADTKGYVFEEERRYPYAYTYRDYVIRAFNEDLPFDQFLIQQLAADLLPLGDDKRPLAALGFLTLGRRFLNNQPDIIDDRIDVVSRGTMGLTVACARCHDHKFDPIPSQDYYSLYGVFASCNEPGEKPLLGNASLPREYPEYVAERAKREHDLKQYREEKEAEVRTRLRAQVGDYLLLARDVSMLADHGKQEALARERKLDPGVLHRWTKSLAAWGKSPHPIFAPWFSLAGLPEKEFAVQAQDYCARLAEERAGTNALNPELVAAFAQPPVSLKEAAERYGKLFAEVDKQWRDQVGQDKTNRAAVGSDASAPSGLPQPAKEALRQILYASDAPPNLDSGALTGLLDTPAQQELRARQRKIDELDATHPGAPPRAMALADNSTPVTQHVFLRGNPSNPGEEAPRRFLKVLAGEKRQPFQHGSGRLELAQAIVSTNNPLTARVFVNRVWLQHFGAPLVRTPSDFGLRSEPPTHPVLLDYLAARFMADGWSLKKLHRLIMLSSAYQQSSANRAAAAQVDPGNQLLWRMNRRRLDFEALRDTLLSVSGVLDPAVGGRPVELTAEPFPARRTVYGFVERQNLPGLFRTFDFASPDATSPQRFSTTVPQQALFLMNSPFVVQQAMHLLHRPELKELATDEERLQALYQLAFQRSPEPEEVRLAEDYVRGQTTLAAPAASAPAWQYGWGEVDEASQRLKAFHPLPHFAKHAWQGGAKLPDSKLGWVMLTAEGGHPGNDPQHTAVRRWTAPCDGTVSIEGELAHPAEKGDGVRGRIVSSNHGLAGEWVAFHEKSRTRIEQLELKRGDTVDFITDCRGDVGYDSFTWSPVIKLESRAPGEPEGGPREWNARSEFSGPQKPKPSPLTPWEKYAQVLLLANELVFVD